MQERSEDVKKTFTSKTLTGEKNFYLPILNALKETTNLSKIQKDLSISKQRLNFYLRRLKKEGIIIHKGRGWYEVVKSSKTSTKYGKLLSKDFIRGHAYIWVVKFPHEIKDWDKRIEILKQKNIHFNLVGALKSTPRIKVLGRKVWLCNNHLRIYDKPNSSYYGQNAIESRKYAFNEVLLIVGALNSKLGVNLRPSDIYFRKEHYALIKNDLAIEHNRKGEIVHISDEFGEWLLIDDSLGEGGELETIGKKSYQTNIPLQKWWNNNKETGFKVTPDFILAQFNNLIQDRQYWAKHQITHVTAIQSLDKGVRKLINLVGGFQKENIAWREDTKKRLKEEILHGRQAKLGEFL